MCSVCMPSDFWVTSFDDTSAKHRLPQRGRDLEGRSREQSLLPPVFVRFEQQSDYPVVHAYVHRQLSVPKSSGKGYVMQRCHSATPSLPRSPFVCCASVNLYLGPIKMSPMISAKHPCRPIAWIWGWHDPHYARNQDRDQDQGQATRTQYGKSRNINPCIPVRQQETLNAAGDASLKPIVNVRLEASSFKVVNLLRHTRRSKTHVAGTGVLRSLKQSRMEASVAGA